MKLRENYAAKSLQFKLYYVETVHEAEYILRISSRSGDKYAIFYRSYPEPDESSPHCTYFNIHFNIILLSKFRSPKWYLPFIFST
jgi:hypothetical protein